MNQNRFDPENVVAVLLSALSTSQDFVLVERNGELYVEPLSTAG